MPSPFARHILDAKKVDYEEVGRARVCMHRCHNPTHIFIVPFDRHRPAATLTIRTRLRRQVDLASSPERRTSMLAGSGGAGTLPQLHINGTLVGDADTVQELEDWGDLDYLLRGETPPPPPEA